MDARDGSEFAALAAKVDELSRTCMQLSLWFCKKGGRIATWHQIA